MTQLPVSERSDVFNDNLIYEGTVPLTCQHLDNMPDDDALTQININNEKVLRMVAALDEMHIDTHEEPGHTHDIARLEFKINMLMDLVGQLLERQLQLPSRRHVCVNAYGMQVAMPEQDTIESGQLIKVSLFFTEAYPRPVVLFVSISSSSPHTVSGQVMALSEAVQDLLERLIFRQHRRNVAQQRVSKS
ncbi:MAG TPA: hypothetical protein ENI64_09480 [Gammaproteobacteria bacterium]|nr:hypothetical protein [Gammaproteobacteria bacterium]